MANEYQFWTYQAEVWIPGNSNVQLFAYYVEVWIPIVEPTFKPYIIRH